MIARVVTVIVRGIVLFRAPGAIVPLFYPLRRANICFQSKGNTNPGLQCPKWLLSYVRLNLNAMSSARTAVVASTLSPIPSASLHILGVLAC